MYIYIYIYLSIYTHTRVCPTLGRRAVAVGGPRGRLGEVGHSLVGGFQSLGDVGAARRVGLDHPAYGARDKSKQRYHASRPPRLAPSLAEGQPPLAASSV